MKVFAVISIGRQILGDLVVIRTEKAFKQASKADSYVNKLRQEQTVDGKAKPIKISTPQGEVNCVCEVGAFEIEIEDDESTLL